MIVDQHPALIVDSMSLCYNIIFGADFLDKCVITLDYKNNLVQWMEYNILLLDASEFFSYNYYTSLLTPIELNSEQDFFSNAFSEHILDAKYEQVNIPDVAFNQTHHSLNQCCDLFKILLKHKKLFDGSLGVYPHKKNHIDLNSGAKPVHHQAYPVPHVTNT